jgi:enoyl-CoA hydratase/carnithine racemase
MNYETINLVIERPLASLLLRRPGTGNEISFRLLKELSDAADQLSDASDVRVLLIEAEGPNFCRGWSAEVLAEPPEPDPFAPIANLTFPVIAALQGEVAGGGLELALACDVRIAADDARFSISDIAEGRIPFGGGTQRLPRAVGKGRALAMLLTGEVLDAPAAYSAGLVMRVVPADSLQAEAAELARRVAARGPIALKFAKEAVHRGLDMTLDQGLRYETDLTVILQTTEDRAEGVKAFFEGRRKPSFRGK